MQNGLLSHFYESDVFVASMSIPWKWHISSPNYLQVSLEDASHCFSVINSDGLFMSGTKVANRLKPINTRENVLSWLLVCVSILRMNKSQIRNALFSFVSLSW